MKTISLKVINFINNRTTGELIEDKVLLENTLNDERLNEEEYLNILMKIIYINKVISSRNTFSIKNFINNIL